MVHVAGEQVEDAPRRRPPLGRLVAMAAVCAVVGGMGAVIVIQQQKIDDLKAGGSQSCTDIKREVTAIMNAAAPGGQPPQPDKRYDAITGTNMILQNPGCFDAKLRATVQTVRDALIQQSSNEAQSEALCRAMGQPWWKC